MRVPLARVKCENCGKEVLIFHKKRLEAKHTFCSTKCFGEYTKRQGLNCICPVCGKKFHVKPSDKSKKQKNCCSTRCMGEYRSRIYKGKNNPNYNNRNANSPLNKGYRIIHCGYYWVLAPNHPFACMNGRIREHRLIAEQHYLTEENSVEINGKRYLSLEYDVHHIDGNKLNNDYKNLMVVTKSEHMKIHHRLRIEKKQKLSS